MKAMTITDVNQMLKNKQISYQMAAELAREIESTKYQQTPQKQQMKITVLAPLEIVSEFF